MAIYIYKEPPSCIPSITISVTKAFRHKDEPLLAHTLPPCFVAGIESWTRVGGAARRRRGSRRADII